MFNNMRGQPIDQKKLQSDENVWITRMMRTCADATCIQSSYEMRLSELRDQSLRAASPAAYEETRSFPVPTPFDGTGAGTERESLFVSA